MECKDSLESSKGSETNVKDAGQHPSDHRLPVKATTSLAGCWRTPKTESLTRLVALLKCVLAEPEFPNSLKEVPKRVLFYE